MWTRILQIGGNFIENSEKYTRKQRKNQRRRPFLLEMSTLNQSVTVWQLYIMFLRVMGPTSSSRNLPVQKYILFSPKNQSDSV
jgi:hypothetical protein